MKPRTQTQAALHPLRGRWVQYWREGRGLKAGRISKVYPRVRAVRIRPLGEERTERVEAEKIRDVIWRGRPVPMSEWLEDRARTGGA